MTPPGRASVRRRPDPKGEAARAGRGAPGRMRVGPWGEAVRPAVTRTVAGCRGRMPGPLPRCAPPCPSVRASPRPVDRNQGRVPFLRVVFRPRRQGGHRRRVARKRNHRCLFVSRHRDAKCTCPGADPPVCVGAVRVRPRARKAQGVGHPAGASGGHRGLTRGADALRYIVGSPIAPMTARLRAMERGSLDEQSGRESVVTPFP